MKDSIAHTMNEPEIYVDYEKWRRLVYHTNQICILVILVTEIAMFFLFQAGNLFLQPIPVYLFRFLILPTLIHIGLIFCGWILARLLKGKERVLNAIPVLQLTLVCFVVSWVHNVFAVTFCTFAFPIFLSSIFSDKRLTNITAALSVLFLTFAQFIGPSYNGVYSQYWLPEYFVALIALLASYLVCIILVQFQEDKNRMLEKVYQSRLEAIRQLNLDQKTGLYGVTAYHRRLEQLLSEDSAEREIAIAILDIDDFKHINDTYGHAKGDEVIVRIAELLRELCGERYFPVRFGGEEFIILFFGGTWQEYRGLVKRLLVEFAATDYSFTSQTITVSAGLARWKPGCDAEALFSQADKALYASKAEGKNRLSLSDMRL